MLHKPKHRSKDAPPTPYMHRSVKGKHAPKPSPTTPTTSWDRVSEWYDDLVGDEGSEFHRNVVLPGAMKLLEAQPGWRVLDVACGQGVLARLLHKTDVEVTGVDASRELIAMARERSDLAIRYVVADAANMTEVHLPSKHFHAAACILGIQNMEAPKPVFEGVARCLVDGGRFVIVMTHPCFRSPKASQWGWDPQAGVQFRRVDRYLLPRKEPIVTHPGKDPTSYTWTFHRPIEAYFRALRQAGMVVDALEEWASHKNSDSGPRAPAENASRREIPMFLAIRAVKVSLTAPESPEPAVGS